MRERLVGVAPWLLWVRPGRQPEGSGWSEPEGTSEEIGWIPDIAAGNSDAEGRPDVPGTGLELRLLANNGHWKTPFVHEWLGVHLAL